MAYKTLLVERSDPKVRTLRETYNIDPARMYVAGLSSGAAMTSILACCHSDLFAACAIHSGVMFQAAHSIGTAQQTEKSRSCSLMLRPGRTRISCM